MNGTKTKESMKREINSESHLFMKYALLVDVIMNTEIN